MAVCCQQVVVVHRFDCLVKPVYNNHPLGLKNVVVMLRVIWKRTVVSKLWADQYGFKLAVVDRWPLFGGGLQSLKSIAWMSYLAVPASSCRLRPSSMLRERSRGRGQCSRRSFHLEADPAWRCRQIRPPLSIQNILESRQSQLNTITQT